MTTSVFCFLACFEVIQAVHGRSSAIHELGIYPEEQEAVHKGTSLGQSGSLVGSLAGTDPRPVPAELSYSQNAICTQSNCVNPVFPALLELGRLEQLQWQCSTRTDLWKYMDFCKSVVNYDAAVPSPSNKSNGVSLQRLVKAQDDAAATQYFFHLNALGMEAWDHTNPESANNECVSSVHRMVCFTYFPKNEAGCKAGEATPFKRPCSNCCANYVRACQVECCDESVSCVFNSSPASVKNGASLLQGGYFDATGPSALCTGGASRQATPSGFLKGFLVAILGLHMASQGRSFDRLSNSVCGLLLSRKTIIMIVLVGLSVSLQGCITSIPRHTVTNWQQKPDYTTAYEYVPPGRDGSYASLNSCGATDASTSLQCSGRGYCKSFLLSSPQALPLAFCQCDAAYTDPECRTKRKSQVTAFSLSLFGGFLGLDQLYLGFPWRALVKCCTLGGFGFWWVLDVVRTGSAPVYASQHRVENNLSHWVFMLSTFVLFVLLGFVISAYTVLRDRRSKRAQAMALQLLEETNVDAYQRKIEQSKSRDFRRAYAAPIGFSGYGATLPINLPNAGAPYAIPGQHSGPPFAGPFGPAAGQNPSYPEAGAGGIPLASMEPLPPGSHLLSAFGPPVAGGGTSLLQSTSLSPPVRAVSAGLPPRPLSQTFPTMGAPLPPPPPAPVFT